MPVTRLALILATLCLSACFGSDTAAKQLRGANDMLGSIAEPTYASLDAGCKAEKQRLADAHDAAGFDKAAEACRKSAEPFERLVELQQQIDDALDDGDVAKAAKLLEDAKNIWRALGGAK
jgi:hypothetical protein